MKTNYITLRPDRLNFPLATLNVGKLSSAVLTVGGDIPEDTAALVVKVEYADSQSTTAYYVAAGTRQADGTFRVYLAPGYFPATTKGLRYHVYITDELTNPRWMGSGAVRIIENPSDGSSPAPEVLPKNLFAYNPVTHLYYRITAEANAAGKITLALEQEGVANP